MNQKEMNKLSILYNGGGSGNDLVKYATAALLIAGLSGMDVIYTDESTSIDIYLGNSVAAQSAKILVSEFSNETPSVATQKRSTYKDVPITDNPSTTDRVIFGLTTGTEIPTKEPIRIPVTRNTWVLISLADDLAGGLWYVRYYLHPKHVEINPTTADGQAATNALLTTLTDYANDLQVNAGDPGDGAVDGDAGGTMSQKLRGVNKVLATLNAAIVGSSGDGLTFTNFDLDEAVAGIADLGTSSAGALVRLAEIDFTMISQGTVDIGYDDDGAGTNAVVLRGPYNLGAGGGINKEFRADPRGAIAEAPDGKHLTVTFTTAGGGGGGRISTGA